MRWYRDYRERQAIASLRQFGAVAVPYAGRNVTRIYLAGPKIGDKELAQIVRDLRYLPKLTEVDLVQTSVSDAGLQRLGSVRGLKIIYLHKCLVTESGIQNLKKSLPDVVVKLEKPDPVPSGLVSRDIYRHAIVAAAISPDAKLLVTGSGDGTLRRWDAADLELQTTIAAHESWLFSVAFSADGTLIATGGGDSLVKLWDAATMQPRGTLSGHQDDVHAVLFRPTGSTLISAGDDKTIRIWDLELQQEQCVLRGHSRPIPSLALSPDGRTLASGGRDGLVVLWDLQTRRQLRILRGHAADVNAVAFSPNGELLASASYDRDVRVWDVATGRLRRVLSGHGDRVFTVRFSPDGLCLASGSGDGSVRLWDLHDLEKVKIWRGQQNVSSILFNPRRQSLITTAAEGNLFVRRLPSGLVNTIVWTRFGERGLSLAPLAQDLSSLGARDATTLAETFRP